MGLECSEYTITIIATITTFCVPVLLSIFVTAIVVGFTIAVIGFRRARMLVRVTWLAAFS